MDPAGLPALQDAIRHMHGVEATWVESVPVHETFQGRTVWEGEVQVFDLADHPGASRCYAWSQAIHGQGRKFYAVLGSQDVDDAAAAVKLSIVADFRKD